MAAAETIPCPDLIWRVVDNDTGSIIVPNLWHPHRSSFIVRALLPGMPGASALGEFVVPLYGPEDPEFEGALGQYLLLARGQRVEAYAASQPTGSPKFTGVITKDPDRPLKGPWSISGADTLWMLQQAQAFQGEAQLSPFSAKFAFDTFHSTREVIWDDDFHNWGGTSSPGNPASTDYTNSGFSRVASDPYQQQPALTSSTLAPTIAWVVTTATWDVNNQYVPSEVRIQGTMTANDAGPGGAGCEAGILLHADNASTGTGVLVQVTMNQTTTSSGLWTVNAAIWSFTAGTYTLKTSIADVFKPVSRTFTFDMAAVSFIWGASRTIRCMLNGKDTGAFWTTSSLPAGSRAIGLRFSATSTTGTTGVWVNRLKFLSRMGYTMWGTPRFQPGTVVDAGNNIQNNIEYNGQTFLDMVLLGAARDGFYIRKTPQAGYKSDILDYNATPGIDRSQQIVFEAGENVESGVVGQVADLFATEVRMSGRPNNIDSGGAFTWSKLQRVGDVAYTDTIADFNTQGVYLLQALARAAGRRKAGLSLQAKEVVVKRTPETADKWRELDYVTFHAPRQGIYKAKVLVIGYDYHEGAGVQTVWLDQYPDRALVVNQLQRMRQPLKAIANAAAIR